MILRAAVAAMLVLCLSAAPVGTEAQPSDRVRLIGIPAGPAAGHRNRHVLGANTEADEAAGRAAQAREAPEQAHGLRGLQRQD